MSTISAPSTPQRVNTKNTSLYETENNVSSYSAKGLFDSSPIASKVYETPLTPVRTPLKDSGNLSSPSQFATSPLIKHDSSPVQHSPTQNITHSPTAITGSYTDKITVGRCSAATYQVGRRNRLLSRFHLSISWNEKATQFELTVLGLNGLKVDDEACVQNDTVALQNGSTIDIVGELVRFQIPSAQKEDAQADDASDFDIQTPTYTAMSLNQHSSNSSTRHDSMPHSHTGNALSQRLLAVVAETSQENKVESVTVAEELNSAQSSVKEIVTEALFKKEYDEQEDVKPEPLANQIAQIETTHVADDKSLQNLRPTHISNDEVIESQVKREESQEINIDVTEPAEAEPVSIEQENNEEPLNIDANYAEMIIEALVFSRKSSMPISDIYTRIMTTNPAYKNQSRKQWIDTIASVLQENDFFGQITRKGKTADGTPKENLYYYRSDKDPVEWRQATYTQVGRSARKCTLQDKQYFWKIPPKLGRNRSSYVPPPAVSSDQKRGRTNAKQDEDEDASNKRLKKRKTSEEEEHEVKQTADK